MSVSTIIVTIAGQSASGKSAIAQLLAEALGTRGVKSQNLDPDHPRTADTLEKALNAISEKTVVQIITVHGPKGA